MSNLRTLAPGFAKKELSEFTQRTKHVFAGDTEENPTIRIPSYFIRITTPKAGQSYADLYKQITKQQSIPPESVFSRKKAIQALRLVFTGTTSSEVEFDHLDVDIKTTRRRWKRSGKTVVTIFNPSKEKVEIIKRGSLIQIYVGWETKTRYLAFYGPVSRVEQEWEDSSDFYIKLTCIQYEEAVMNNTTYYPSNVDNVAVQGDAIKISEGFLGEGGYYDALEKLVDEYLSPRAKGTYGIKLSLDTGFRTIIKLRDVSNTVKTLKFSIKPERTQSMAEVLDDFFRQSAPTNTGGSNVTWWVNNKGKIKFPYNEDIDQLRIDGSAIIGDNAFKISIISDSSDLLDTTGEILTEPTQDRQDVSLVVHMNGRGSTQLQNLFTINEAFSESVINTLEQQAANFGLEDFKNLKWIVDQIDHTMDSEKQFVTRLILVQPGETNDINPTGRKSRSKDRFNVMADFKKDSTDYTDKKIYELEERMTSFVLYSITDKKTGRELPAGVNPGLADPTLIEEDRDNPEDTDIDPTLSPQAQTTITSTNDPTIVDAPANTDQPADNYLTAINALNSSPWAVEFLDKKSATGKFYGGGVWFPISKLPYSEMRRRALMQTVGGIDVLGLSHWAQGKAPIGYHTDYIFRTPSRSIDLIPTEENDGGKLIPDSDDGTRTQIYSQYLIDANPLFDGRVRGIISRPHIKDIMESTGDTGTKDDDIVFMVSNKNRTVTTKIIIRQHPTGQGVQLEDPVPADAAPEIHIILDDKRADGERQEFIMTNVDGSTPNVKLISGKTQIESSGVSDSEKISMKIDKDAATTSEIVMDTTGITITFDTSDLTKGSIAIIENQIDMNAPTVNIDATTTSITGDLDVDGVITGGA